MLKNVRRFLAVSFLMVVFFAINSFAADGRAKEAFDMVNEIRVQNGLQPLTWNTQIESAANTRAQEIDQSFSHTRPNGQPWHTADSTVLYGENLAVHFASAQAVVTAWMNSPTHRDNILKADFTSGAIAIYEIDGKVCWAEEFGYAA